jgi:Glucodextranase, domain B
MSPLTIPTVSIERALKIGLLVFLTLLFILYASFQARNLIQGPRITLTAEHGVIQHERALTLLGEVRNVVVIRLNGREIHTDERGHFEHSLMLENGYTIMTIEAEDRYGRTTTLTRTYVYQPKT